jgi:hypothetical protein
MIFLWAEDMEARGLSHGSERSNEKGAERVVN